MKTLCLRSALCVLRDWGVMCSATQKGFRVRRSKEEVRLAAGRRSAMGPGKPYWKRPLGSTGAGARALVMVGGEGMGTGWPVREGETAVVVVVTVVGVGVSLRKE